MNNTGLNLDAAAKQNAKLLVDTGAGAAKDKFDTKRPKPGYFSSLNTSKLNHRLTGNLISLQRSVEARKKAPGRVSEKPQRSFTLENHTESTEATAGAITKQANGTHKRTKTLGEKPNFILDKSKPKVINSGGSLMAKLSEKLHLDLGKISQDKASRRVEVHKKHATGEYSQRLNFETNSLAKRIVEMKSSNRPLTERNNANHLGALRLPRPRKNKRGFYSYQGQSLHNQ